MLDTPKIVQTTDRHSAVIHLTIPRSEIQQVMGPGISEIFSTLAAQGISPTGPWFTHHLKMDPGVFDFEICVPVATPVAASGRVTPGTWPAMRVIQTQYRGGYEGLGNAWGEFMSLISAQGHKTAEDLYECYVVGPESGPDSTAYCTELSRRIL
jgi:effector-binding domain-containing protein